MGLDEFKEIHSDVKLRRKKKFIRKILSCAIFWCWVELKRIENLKKTFRFGFCLVFLLVTRTKMLHISFIQFFKLKVSILKAFAKFSANSADFKFFNTRLVKLCLSFYQINIFFADPTRNFFISNFVKLQKAKKSYSRLEALIKVFK